MYGIVCRMCLWQCVCVCGASLYKPTHNSLTKPDILIFNKMVGINPLRRRYIFSLNIFWSGKKVLCIHIFVNSGTNDHKEKNRHFFRTQILTQF